MELPKTKDLAYWLGVAQSDGYFGTYLQKNRKSPRHVVKLEVSEKSLPMLEKFRLISKDIFETNMNVFREKRGRYIINVHVTRFLEKFKELNIRFKEGFIAPPWIIDNNESFGCYLAGIIDGDGNVRIRRPKYPQCVIRIFSGSQEGVLINNLKEFLNCSILSRKRYKKSYFKKENRYIEGRWFEIEFVVSKKNYHQINNYVLNNLALEYKRDAIKNFINKMGQYYSLLGPRMV